MTTRRGSQRTLVATLLGLVLLAPVRLRAEDSADAGLVAPHTQVPRLEAPAPYKVKDGVLEIEIHPHAGYAGLIVANGGLEPNEQSPLAKKLGSKVRISLSKQEGWRNVHAGRSAASATTVDVLAVQGPQLHVVVPALIGFSRGVDGIVLRGDVNRISDLKGHVLATVQFTEGDYFVRCLAREASLQVNVLADLKTPVDPTKLNLVFCADGAAAADLLLKDMSTGRNRIAGCTAWASQATALAAASGGRAGAQTTKRHLLTLADVLVVNRAFAQTRPSVVAELVDALLAGNAALRTSAAQHLDTLSKAFGWTVEATRAELAKVHLANLPENQAFFDGTSDSNGSFDAMLASAAQTYGVGLVPTVVPSEELVAWKGLAAAAASGAYKDQKPVLSLGTGGADGPLRGRARRRKAATVPAQKAREEAVLHALRWLAAHQSANGGWECAGWGTWCDGAKRGAWGEGGGKPEHDVGATGLALCAFLGAGYTSRGGHEFAAVVRKGLAYLMSVQDAEGCVGPRKVQRYIYSHAIAALAIVEAYGLTGSSIYKEAAQRALDFTSNARNPEMVWRYGVRPGDNDSSVTGWMTAVLTSARWINEEAAKLGKPKPLTYDAKALEGVRAWLEKMTDPDGRGGYYIRGEAAFRTQALASSFPIEKTESMTAVGVLTRIFLGDDVKKDPIVRNGAELCAKCLPTWDTSGSIDMYYWYFGTLALYQVGGDAWSQWEKAMAKSIVATQHVDGGYCDFKGSWDPVDPWGSEGGRIYSTAMLAMCLEATYRYPRLSGVK